MELIPAIDLLGGAVVRLARGEFDQVTDYGHDPVAAALYWQNRGATRLHLVDLEAARDGTRGQAEVIQAIVAAVGIPCQVAGGIRDTATAEAILAAGANRVVMGTALILDETLAGVLIARVGPSRIVAAIDVRDGAAVGDGWTAGASTAPATDHIARLRRAGVEHFAVTAIDRDGLLSGPDLGLLAAAADAAGGTDRVIASAGVSSLEDVRALAAAGYQGAILGRALYERRFELEAALSLVV